MRDLTFKMAIYPKNELRKWDVVTAGKGEVIVIRHITPNVVTLHPYKRHNKKWRHWLWFKWLKLKVWIGDITGKK